MAHDTVLLSRHKLSQWSRERLMDMEGSLYTSVLNEQCKSSLWLSSGPNSRLSAFGVPNHESKCELLQFESHLTKDVEYNKCFRNWQGQDFIVKLQPLFSTHEKIRAPQNGHSCSKKMCDSNLHSCQERFHFVREHQCFLHSRTNKVQAIVCNSQKTAQMKWFFLIN